MRGAIVGLQQRETRPMKKSERLQQLLNQLKENQQRDLENTAAIFTVAQVTLNEINKRLEAY